VYSRGRRRTRALSLGGADWAKKARRGSAGPCGPPSVYPQRTWRRSPSKPPPNGGARRPRRRPARRAPLAAQGIT